MANTKKTTKQSNARGARSDAPDRGAWREVTGIILIGIGLALMYFLLLDTDSTVGKAVNLLLNGLAGLLRYLIPIGFCWVGVMLAFSSKEHRIKPFRVVLIVLLALCLCGFFHAFVFDRVLENMRLSTFGNFLSMSYQYQKGGGGVLGAILVWPLYYWMGMKLALTLISLIIIATADLVLLRKVSLRKLGERMQERYEGYIEQRAQRPDPREDNVAQMRTGELPRQRKKVKSVAEFDELERWPNDSHPKEYPVSNSEKRSIPVEDAVAGAVARQRNSGIPEMTVPKFTSSNAPAKPVKRRGVIETVEPIEAEQPEQYDDVPEFLNKGKRTRAKADKDGDKLHIKEPRPLFNAHASDSAEKPAAGKRTGSLASGTAQFPPEQFEDWQEMSIGDALYDEGEFPESMTDRVSLRDDHADVDDFYTDEPSFDEESLPPVNPKNLPKAKPAPKRTAVVMPVAAPAGKKTEKNTAPYDQTDEEPYNYPPIDILHVSASSKVKNQEQKDEEKARTLIATLQSFGISARLIGIAHGPTVTRFELTPAAGVKVSRITALADDIALNLAAISVRIEAPIPGKAAVGVEVPNDVVEVVPLRDVLESNEARRHPSRLVTALGRDNAGRYIVADLAKMPHVLIAGATGAGKSVCINCIICSILYRATPDEVRLIMIDPKVVELSAYNGIPHLLVPVVTDPKKAASALEWAVQEMTSRYKKFAELGVRDMKGFNQHKQRPKDEPLMPQIVIIIDELADLMMVTPGEVEDAICRLAQLARAAGIHLVIATQRPSVNVITGVIKANIPSRIAFTVASQVDSRTILDVGGAEKLLGRGDMLFAPSGSNKPTRVQGAWVSDDEVHDVVDYIKKRHETSYDEDIIEHINNAEMSDAEKEESLSEFDELLPQAVEIAVEAGQASISMLQRRLRVGYARAGRLIDEMASRGVVSQAEGAKPRNVLISREQFRMMFDE